MTKAQAKQRYDDSLEAARGVIHQWDPYGLLAIGCPLDEFDGEIGAVVRQIGRIASAHDATRVISRVFSSAFEPERFQVANCAEVGQKLYDVLKERELLPKRVSY